MKKITTLIISFTIVSLSTFTIPDKANADIFIPGQTQNQHSRPVPPNSNASLTPSNINIPKFTKYLRIGASGQDVKNLQIFLNSQGFTVSASGAGSLGNETTYFGPATYKSLIKFQNYYASSILTPVGMTNGTGYFGPSTISKVNQLIEN